LTANEAVSWIIEAEPGIEQGSIDSGGVYTAPERVPANGKVIIRAQSEATGEMSYAVLYIASAADGSFQFVSTIARDHSVTLLDADGDGLADMISVFPNALTDHHFYKGNGNGTFGQAANLLTDVGYLGEGPLYSADLDKNGRTDLIGFSSNTIYVCWGNGNGTFTPGYSIPTGIWLRDLAIADFNGDGWLDIATADSGSGTGTGSVRVFMNDALTGQMGDSLSYAPGAAGAQPFLVRVADVNGDNQFDLVLANYGTSGLSTSSITVLLNQGGVFGSPLNTPTPDATNVPGYRALAVRDVNGDGKADIVFCTTDNNGLLVYAGQGNGTFETDALFSLTETTGFQMGDFNQDIKADLILSRYTTLELWTGNGNGTFSLNNQIMGNSVSQFSVTDLNGDSNYDLGVNYYNTNTSVSSIGTLIGGPTGSTEIGVRITPEIAKVNVGRTIEITAEVTGTLGNSLKWYVNGTENGSSLVGLISGASNLGAVYTPPASLNGLTEVIVEARLTANETVKDSSVIGLTDYHWDRYSNGLGGLSVNILQFSQDGIVLYAGTESGVYKKMGSGNWQEASGGTLAGKPIQAIAVDRNNPQVVYAGVYQPMGYNVYKTVNGGNNWTVLSQQTGEITNLVIDPYDADNLLVGSLSGLYKVTGGDITWTKIEPAGLSTPIYSEAAIRAGDVEGRFYAAINGILLRSNDHGSTWSVMDVAGGYTIKAIWIDPLNSSYMLLGATKGSLGFGLETRDGGATWNEVTALGNIAFSSLTPATILSGGSGVWISSSESELSFHDISTGLESILNVYDTAIAPQGGEHPGAFYAATYNGVYIANTGTTTAPGARIQGATYEAKGIVLANVTLTLDANTSVISGLDGVYQIMATTLGSHTIVASKTGYRNQTQIVDVTDLSAPYTKDFKGAFGLVPNAPNASYVGACINRWKFPPADGTGLTASKVGNVINAWKFPIVP
jgi:hypothetical protein